MANLKTLIERARRALAKQQASALPHLEGWYLFEPGDFNGYINFADGGPGETLELGSGAINAQS